MPSGKAILKSSARQAWRISSASLCLLLRGSYTGASAAGKTAYEHRRELSGAAVVTGTAAAASAAAATRSLYDLYSNIGFSKKRLDKTKSRIDQQAQEYRDLKSQYDRKLAVIDSVAIGGDVLRDYLDGTSAPSDRVVEAYQLAFPSESAQYSFSEKITSLDEAGLVGFASAVKGKLFELQYVDWLNEGNLPVGYQASLADSATQPGWDIAVKGPDGEIAEVLQAKATESASYVTSAIGKYPQIDVVTTDEVHSHLVLQGAADSVRSSGMSNLELTAEVAEAADGTAYSLGLGLPVISLALIAFTAYSLPEATAFQKARHAGSRLGPSYIAFLAGQVALVATQTWWLGAVVGVTSRFAMSRGNKRRMAWGELKRIERSNRQLLKTMRSRLKPRKWGRF